MRVVSGKYRGLNLVPFEGEDIRPTADRVKESLFNILSARVVGAVVADVFCGSGNLGIECLSRGAECVYFNDLSNKSLEVLRKNLAKLRGGEKYFVTRSDYLSFLKGTSARFDLIFVDPPYRYDYGLPALRAVAERDLLNEGGVLVYERDRAFEGETYGLVKSDERKYGRTYLTFFTRS